MDARRLEALFKNRRAAEAVGPPLAEIHFPTCRVADVAGGSPVDADEAEPAHDPLRTDDFRQSFAVSQAVLQREYLCFPMQQGRQDRGELVVRRRLPSHDDEIHRADFVRRPAGLHCGEFEISMHARDLQPLAGNRLVIRPQQEAHVLARRRQSAAIIQADGT